MVVGGGSGSLQHLVMASVREHVVNVFRKLQYLLGNTQILLTGLIIVSIQRHRTQRRSALPTVGYHGRMLKIAALIVLKATSHTHTLL